MKYVDESGNRISTPLAWGLIGVALASQNGQSVEEGFLAGYMHGRGLQKQRNNNDLDRAFGTGNFFHGIQFSNLSSWLTSVYNDMRRKPFELNDKRALRKEEDAHKRRSIACSAYFGFGTDEYAECYAKSYALRTKNRTDIKIKTRWWPGYDHSTGEPLVQFSDDEYVEREIKIMYFFRCGRPSGVSTPHCPSKDEIKG